MKKTLWALALCIMLAGILACADAAKGLYDSAQLEEKQRNYEHAAKLYKEIVEKYPASEYAPKAKERLAKITGGGQ